MVDDQKPKPAPELAAEARSFVAQIRKMLDNADMPDILNPDPLRFTITMPREVALMAAWVMLKEAARQQGQPALLGRSVMLHLDGGRRGYDWELARRYFERAIFREFDKDYTNLEMQTHPLLFPSRPKPELLPINDATDNDIPI